MPRVSTYLLFDGDAAAALDRYRETFGTDHSGPVRWMESGPLA